MIAAPRPMKVARNTIAPSYPVEEHPVLILERDDEGREDHREDEDVVDRQAELEQVAGEGGCAILGAACEEDERPKGEAQRDVEGAGDLRLHGTTVHAPVD